MVFCQIRQISAASLSEELELPDESLAFDEPHDKPEHENIGEEIGAGTWGIWRFVTRRQPRVDSCVMAVQGQALRQMPVSGQ